MTAITLPTSPTPRDEISPRLLDFGRETDPARGGVNQSIGRLGSRFELDVVLPAMKHADARAWLAARLRSRTEKVTVIYRWPQTPLEGGDVGTPLVKGAGQTGSVLTLDGLTPDLVIPALTPFSFVVDSHHYLHLTSDTATVDGTGEVDLPIGPLLRASPADNTAVEFEAPVIEGFIRGDLDWTLKRLSTIGISFTLYENR